MTFPHKLRTLRKRLNLSQAQAAELLGLTRSAIGHYERGLRLPPADDVRRQSEILADLERLAKQREK